MHLSSSILNTATATAFVGALSLVGWVSHTGAEVSLDSSAVRGALQSKYEDAFKAANPLQDLAISVSASVRYGLLDQTSEGALAGENGWLFTAEEMETSPDFAANMRASVAYIAHVQQTLADQGIQLLTVAVPDKAEIYEEHLGARRPAQVQTRYTDFVRSLDVTGIDHVDARASLLQAKPGGIVFMRDDTHWSPRGAQAVADAVGQRLAGVDLSRLDVATTRLAEDVFDGDLLAYTPTGALRPFVGPVQWTIDRYETTVATSGGLFGDAAVEVALVGTSFSAKTDWHFEGFLKTAMQADILNVAREGQGPFAPMETFLQSDLLQSTPPKIVIWEIPVRYVTKDLNK